MKIYYIKKYLGLILLSTSITLYAQEQYKDIVSMLSHIKPFSHSIEPGFIEAIYNNDLVTSIFWFDQDSIKFSKIFHYNDNQKLYLITEYREAVMLKEYFFNSHPKTDQFINYLFGDNFKANNDGYITEIQYNRYRHPIMYQIKSMQDDYIGHITLNYNNKNSMIREAWFHSNSKIKEFYISDSN